MSIERQRDILQRQIDELIEGIAQLKSENGERFSIKQLEKSKKSIEAKLKNLMTKAEKTMLSPLKNWALTVYLLMKAIITKFISLYKDDECRRYSTDRSTKIL